MLMYLHLLLSLNTMFQIQPPCDGTNRDLYSAFRLDVCTLIHDYYFFVSLFCALLFCVLLFVFCQLPQFFYFYRFSSRLIHLVPSSRYLFILRVRIALSLFNCQSFPCSLFNSINRWTLIQYNSFNLIFNICQFTLAPGIVSSCLSSCISHRIHWHMFNFWRIFERCFRFIL